MLQINKISTNWRKKFFVIIYYVSRFKENLKSRISQRKYQKLFNLHFKLIDDISNKSDLIDSINLKHKLNYNEIVLSSHTNKIKIFQKKGFLCIFIVFFLIIKLL